MNSKPVVLIYISLLGLDLGAQEPLKQDTVIESNPRVATLISRLRSDSHQARIGAARDIYGSGIDSENLYGVVASIIDDALRDIDGESPHPDEIAWMAKALGTSGDSQYLPLLDRVIASGIRGVKSHAEDAREVLVTASEAGAPFLDWTKVMVITETQAETCEYVNQRTCSTGRSMDRCVDSHKANAAREGANAILPLYANKDRSLIAPLGQKGTMVANYYRCER